MRIIKVADDIFKFAPEHCRGAVLWLKTGFNSLATNWHFEFEKNLEATGSVVKEKREGEWVEAQLSATPHAALLYRFEPPFQQLEFVYIHPNPHNDHGVPPAAVPEMVVQALTELNTVGCRTVAMNGIHSLDGAGNLIKGPENNHSRIMVDAVRNWAADQSVVEIERVYLVDLDGAFGKAEAENRKIR
jgi:hypothetical protein